MHIYIYDSFLSHKKYDSVTAKIETRLTDLGLNGKIIRLGLLQSLKDSLGDEIKKGAKTIVAVGNNNLLHQIVNAIASFYAQNDFPNIIPIGFIPIEEKESSLGLKLGLPLGPNACDILSARRIEKLDIGQVNNKYFLSEAIISTDGTTVNVDNSYTIEINEVGEIGVINLADKFILPKDYNSNAQDSKLDFLIQSKKSNNILSMRQKTGSPSIFSFKSISIQNKKGLGLLIDSSESVQTPAVLKIADKKINIIVGKGRAF